MRDRGLRDGAAFSGYLLYAQLRLIGAVCDWCLVSDAITSALAAVALLRLRWAPVAGVAAARPPAR